MWNCPRSFESTGTTQCSLSEFHLGFWADEVATRTKQWAWKKWLSTLMNQRYYMINHMRQAIIVLPQNGYIWSASSLGPMGARAWWRSQVSWLKIFLWMPRPNIQTHLLNQKFTATSHETILSRIFQNGFLFWLGFLGFHGWFCSRCFLSLV